MHQGQQEVTVKGKTKLFFLHVIRQALQSRFSTLLSAAAPSLD